MAELSLVGDEDRDSVEDMLRKIEIG